MAFSERDQQIRQTHAPLIHQVVKACQNPAERAPLESMLKMLVDSGWTELDKRIRLIVDGKRDASLTLGLDDEDSVIIQSILQGLQNPTSLPDPTVNADPAAAAPGLAHMIHAASHGDAQALQALAHMAEHMLQVRGDMRQLGGIINRLLKGERDPEVLSKGMGASGEKLVLNILEELNKLAPQ
jgi:hypothetical protein